nr:Chain A, alpha4H [synthetic construct]3TWE_B Chain B, alpha4H [synthetic construct]
GNADELYKELEDLQERLRKLRKKLRSG